MIRVFKTYEDFARSARRMRAKPLLVSTAFNPLTDIVIMTYGACVTGHGDVDYLEGCDRASRLWVRRRGLLVTEYDEFEVEDDADFSDGNLPAFEDLVRTWLRFPDQQSAALFKTLFL